MRPQELNMLIVFDAIMTEGSITRAAERLSMTQPAVSNSVSRMRIKWNDDLFIRSGRTIQPTLFAKNLWHQIQEPIQELSLAITPDSFNPKTSTRTFRIGAADLVVDLLWGKLRRILDDEAPNINIYAHPYTITNGAKMLEDAEVDIAIRNTESIPGAHRNQMIFTSKYCCIMRKDHPLEKGPFNLEQFANASYVMVSLSGDSTGTVDRALARHDLSRRIAMTVNHFSGVIPIVENSDLIAVIPTSAISREVLDERIIMRQSPIAISDVALAAFWHQRQESDAGLIWLKEKIVTIFSDFSNDHNQFLQQHFTY